SPEPVLAWASDADSQSIVTMSAQGIAARWHAPAFQDKTLLFNTGSRPNWASISSDGRHLAVGASNGLTQVWNVQTRQRLPTFLVDPGNVTQAEFSGDGRYLKTVRGIEGTNELWDVLS